MADSKPHYDATLEMHSSSVHLGVESSNYLKYSKYSKCSKWL